MCIRDSVEGVVYRDDAQDMAVLIANGNRHEVVLGPVSYTHLDVYKRQGHELGAKREQCGPQAARSAGAGDAE